MNAGRDAVRACLAAVRAGHDGVLVTVVDVAGSTYRRPGARMFLPRAGRPVGLVSGGCLESDLAERAAAVLLARQPATVLYDMRSPDDVVWGLGLGCDGAIRVLLEPMRGGVVPAELAFLERCAAERQAGVVATVFAVDGAPVADVGDRRLVSHAGDVVYPCGDANLDARLHEAAVAALDAGRSSVVQLQVESAKVAALVEHVAPPLRLVICGAGIDALPVVEQAAALGWDVIVLDQREAYAQADRFPQADVRVVEWSTLTAGQLPLDARTAVVLMTHHFLHDVEILRSLAQRQPAFVGLLGPQRRARKLVAELEQPGGQLEPEVRAALHGPVGLDIGSETPEEIALSLVAEIQAVFAGRRGEPLREREGPLHDWSS